MKPIFFSIILFISVQSGWSQQSLPQSYRQSEADNYNPLTDILGWFVSEITYGILVESFFEKDTPMHDAGLTPYPYFYNREGNYTYDKDAVPFRLEVNSSYHLAPKQKYFWNADANLRLLKRFSIQLAYVKLPQTTGSTEYLSQTDISFSYHRIRTRRFDLWYGLGAMFSDNPSNHNGVSYHIGAELFLPEHLSVEGQAHWAYFDPVIIKNYQVQVNYFISHWRLTAGLKNYRYPDNRINSIGLGLKYYF